MNRIAKITHLADFLTKRCEDAILDRNHHIFDSRDIEDLDADDIVAILTLLERQPNCITFSHERLYKNKQEVLDTDDPYICRQFDYIEPVVDQEDERRWNDLISYCLSIVKFEVTMYDGFKEGVSAILNDKPQTKNINEDSVALELKKKNGVLTILIDGREYDVNNHLLQGFLFEPLIEYAFNHQGKEFKITDVDPQSKYKNYDALRRIFKDPIIYKAFFTIHGDRGSLIANFKPTFKELKKKKVSVDKIKSILTP